MYTLKKVLCLATILVAGFTSCEKLEEEGAEVEKVSSLAKSGVLSSSGVLTVPPIITQTTINNFNTANSSNPLKHLTISNDYRVEVKLSTSTIYQEVQVFKTDNYAVASGSDRRPQTSASFANFSFTSGNTIDIRVTGIQPLTGCVVRPKRLGINPVKINTYQYTFSINAHQKLSLDMNGNRLNPLFIFGSPPEPTLETSAPGAINFAPGTITNVDHMIINSGARINIPAGAIVQGNFVLPKGTSNVKFLGHGIITSGNLNFSATGNIKWDNSTFAPDPGHRAWNGVNNVSWEGLTIVNAAQWVFACTYGNEGTNNETHSSHHNTFRDLKQVHWNPETDPIWFDGDYNTVNDCFLFANDDVTSHGSNNCTLSNIVIWQGGNGGHLLMLDNYSSSNIITYDNIDLIGQDNVMETVLLKATQPLNKTFNNISIKNVYAEERTAPSSYWKNRFFSMYAPTNTGKYSVSNFVFDNIRLPNQNPATDGEGILAPALSVTGLKFTNLYMGGTKMMSLSGAHISKNANVTGEVFQ